MNDGHTERSVSDIEGARSGKDGNKVDDGSLADDQRQWNICRIRRMMVKTGTGRQRLN